jgi:hypothetical protein
MEFGKVIMLRETTEQRNKINHYFVDILLGMLILIIVKALDVGSKITPPP